MKNQNGTPATKPRKVTTWHEEAMAARAQVAALTAKAAALDALVEAAGAIAAGVRNDYPNPMWDGASVFVPMPRVVALESALSAAKAAQAQS